MSKSGNPLTRLIEQQGEPTVQELPSVHVTNGYSFRNILGTRTLVPSPDDVFKTEQLLYFFYGKPSYRPSANQQLEPSDAEYSAAFILKPGSLGKLKVVKRVFPF